MKIRDFIKRFNTKKELDYWLKKQSKDYLYALYMEDTNYEGVGYRDITRADLKNIFIEKYRIENEEIINYN